MRHTSFTTLLLFLWHLPAIGAEALTAAAAEQQESPGLSRELASTPRVIAEAYECDEYLEMVSEQERRAYKPIDYEIRVCIRPVTPTRNRGIVMRTIDDFTWYKSMGSTVQSAVRNKLDQPRTLAVCIPGRVICSFKTKLIDDFFYGSTNGTIVGSGSVSMQVDGHEDNPEIRRQLGADENGIIPAMVEWNDGRNLQTGSALNGFAGSSGVKLEIYVDRKEPPKNFVPYSEDDVSSWWEDSPTWLKVLVILGAIIIFLMGCCLCWMCLWSIRESMNDKDKDFDDDEQLEQAPGVQVNQPVGVGTSPWDQYDPSDTEDATIDPNVQPTDNDVCFDADQHPGTKAMHKAVTKTVKKYPTEEYSPEQYRHIKKQLPGRKFFVCDDENQPDVWREVQKDELAELLRKEYEDMQQRQGPSDALTLIDE